MWISSKKGNCFDFNHSLASVPYFIHLNWISRSTLSFGFADLRSLFISNKCFNADNALGAKATVMTLGRKRN